MKKPITVAEVKEGDFIRLDGGAHGAYVTYIDARPYARIVLDDGDATFAVERAPDSTVWLVTP